jgi:radical SAM superfamily enzyme with C-terminal helix-hairpin-helix motif
MPYVGTYPRYLYGALVGEGAETFYLTIDDLRASVRGMPDNEALMKTPIAVRNTTPLVDKVEHVLSTSDVIFVIAGVHSPGKYLSAFPGTTKEVHTLLSRYRLRAVIVLTGPAALGGSGLWGGKRARSTSSDDSLFDLVCPYAEYKVAALIDDGFLDDVDVAFDYDTLHDIAVRGAGIVSHLPHDTRFHIAEVETMSGCQKTPPCSFCTEQMKSPEVRRRPARHIVDEVAALSRAGLRNVRLGKQTCIYSLARASSSPRCFARYPPSATCSTSTMRIHSMSRWRRRRRLPPTARPATWPVSVSRASTRS